jgi:hypothetical protein
MIDWHNLREMTLTLRRSIADALMEFEDRADVIPPGWNNNLRWHAGHLAIVPRSLTRGLFGRPIGVSDEWVQWFRKGSAPTEWDPASIPPLADLTRDLVDVIPELFDEFESHQEEPFPKPYKTSTGVVLASPGDALTFNIAHDFQCRTINFNIVILIFPYFIW